MARKLKCPHCQGLKECACEVCGTGPRGEKRRGKCKVCNGRGYTGIEVGYAELKKAEGPDKDPD